MFGALLELEVEQLLHYFCFFIESLKPDLSLFFCCSVLIAMFSILGGMGQGLFHNKHLFYCVCVSVWSIKAILLIVKIKGKETIVITTIITL